MVAKCLRWWPGIGCPRPCVSTWSLGRFLCLPSLLATESSCLPTRSALAAVTIAASTDARLLLATCLLRSCVLSRALRLRGSGCAAFKLRRLQTVLFFQTAIGFSELRCFVLCVVWGFVLLSKNSMDPNHCNCSHSLLLLPITGDNGVSGNTGSRLASMTDFSDPSDPASKPSNKNSAIRLVAHRANNCLDVSREVNKILQQI